MHCIAYNLNKDDNLRPLSLDDIQYPGDNRQSGSIWKYLSYDKTVPMPRKFFKRIMPSHTEIKNHKYLSIFGEALHNPNLWHMNRRSVAGAFAVGLFFAWIPLPLQMVMAAAAAIIFHTNLTLSVVVVWITNPFTIPPMFYFAYLVGTWILGQPPVDFEFQLTFEWLQNELASSWKPFLTGCLVMATLSSAIGYYAVSQFWTFAVRKERSKRLGRNK